MTRYISSPDHASPTNTGIWLAKPRRWVHSQARSVCSNSTSPISPTSPYISPHLATSPQACNVMANSTFSPATGYDGVGKPLDLWGHRRSSTRLLHQLHAGEP